MTYRIRTAESSDLDAVVTIVKNAARHMTERGIIQWDDDYPGRAILAEDIRRGQLSVLAESDAVAGLIVLNEEMAPEYADVSWTWSGRILGVHRLAVDPGRQGRGLATRLMDFAEQEAAVRGYDAIRVDTYMHNPQANALYAGRGYRRAGTVRFDKGLFWCYENPVSAELTVGRKA